MPYLIFSVKFIMKLAPYPDFKRTLHFDSRRSADGFSLPDILMYVNVRHKRLADLRDWQVTYGD